LREVLALEKHAGVVDQNIGTPELAAQACREGRDGTGVGHVGGVCEDVVTARAQLPRGVFDRLGMAANHQHLASGGGQIARHRQAKPACRAGNDSKFLR
jgi:hypothetical protein